MSNHLKNETSPYLLQHAENPVDWYPWGDEAFARAKAEDKPIFLSIGYSTCHWCHVMAHESFENEEIAKVLNDRYIAIKVDCEERPDIDSVYMSVCQALTGSGGWPMSIFMSWDRKPFFAGTYYPPQDSLGRIGFAGLLTGIAALWAQDKGRLLQSADFIVARLREAERSTDQKCTDTLIEDAVQTFADTFDYEFAGFGRAPKFPAPHNLLFLMRYATQNQDMSVLSMVDQTLLQMRKGGIFDQIGFGFSRYSTDAYFLAPHFEKMLYDNSLLIMAYAAAYPVTKDELYLDTAKKTAGYILREMTSEEGGFYSAQDADSDGVEGKYYTFRPDEILQVLGEEKGRRFAAAFDITEEGNFEGVNIPNLLKSNELKTDFTEELDKLYAYRRKRTSLHLDDKMLLSWNAMMITALSMLYRVSGDAVYLAAAQRAQKYIEDKMCNGMQLHASIRKNRRSEQAFLDDYAYYVTALIELYNSTLDRGYLELAEDFCQEATELFADKENGGFYLSSTCTANGTDTTYEKDAEHGMSSEELFMNPKETYDGAVPSGNSVMAYNLVRLYQLTEQEVYRGLAEKQFHFLAQRAREYPAGHSLFLFAKLIYDNPPTHITIAVKELSELRVEDMDMPLLANVCVTKESTEYPLLNNSITYYVCRDHMCLPAANVLSV